MMSIVKPLAIRALTLFGVLIAVLVLLVVSLGATGLMTLLDFGARSARVDQARAAYEQTVAEYRQTVLVAFQQTEDQLSAVRVLEQVEEQRAAATEAATQAEQITLNQYVAGVVSYSDVILVQATALSARQASIAATLNRQMAAIAERVIQLGEADNGLDPRSLGTAVH